MMLMVLSLAVSCVTHFHLAELPTGLKTVTVLSFELCPTFLLTFSLLLWCPIRFVAISRVLRLLKWHCVSFAISHSSD